MSLNILFEDLGVKDYKETWDYQETVFNEIIDYKRKPESERANLICPSNRLIFVEHPHVYTLGKSGSEGNLLIDPLQLQNKGATFYRTNRGGDITYHGPGQIVGYPIINLDGTGMSLKDYVHRLEESVILAISNYGLKGERLPGATGVWLDAEIPGKARKICAIGVRASHYTTMHGFALNVNTDLNYFSYIHPCGFIDKTVTSLKQETGSTVNFKEAKRIVRESFEKVFHVILI